MLARLPGGTAALTSDGVKDRGQRTPSPGQLLPADCEGLLGRTAAPRHTLPPRRSGAVVAPADGDAAERPHEAGGAVLDAPAEAQGVQFAVPYRDAAGALAVWPEAAVEAPEAPQLPEPARTAAAQAIEALGVNADVMRWEVDRVDGQLRAHLGTRGVQLRGNLPPTLARAAFTHDWQHRLTDTFPERQQVYNPANGQVTEVDASPYQEFGGLVLGDFPILGVPVAGRRRGVARRVQQLAATGSAPDYTVAAPLAGGAAQVQVRGQAQGSVPLSVFERQFEDRQGRRYVPQGGARVWRAVREPAPNLPGGFAYSVQRTATVMMDPGEGKWYEADESVQPSYGVGYTIDEPYAQEPAPRPYVDPPTHIYEQGGLTYVFWVQPFTHEWVPRVNTAGVDMVNAPAPARLLRARLGGAVVEVDASAQSGAFDANADQPGAAWRTQPLPVRVNGAAVPCAAWAGLFARRPERAGVEVGRDRLLLLREDGTLTVYGEPGGPVVGTLGAVVGRAPVAGDRWGMAHDWTGDVTADRVAVQVNPAQGAPLAWRVALDDAWRDMGPPGWAQLGTVRPLTLAGWAARRTQPNVPRTAGHVGGVVVAERTRPVRPGGLAPADAEPGAGGPLRWAPEQRQWVGERFVGRVWPWQARQLWDADERNDLSSVAQLAQAAGGDDGLLHFAGLPAAAHVVLYVRVRQRAADGGMPPDMRIVGPAPAAPGAAVAAVARGWCGPVVPGAVRYRVAAYVFAFPVGDGSALRVDRAGADVSSAWVWLPGVVRMGGIAS